MNMPEDVVPEPLEAGFALAPQDDEQATSFQEINERRARVENAELLHDLRGL
jgi:hypothetical protein